MQNRISMKNIELLALDAMKAKQKYGKLTFATE